MDLITWSGMFSAGLKEQDNQHKKLILIINQLYNAMHSGKGAELEGKVLTELINYTLFHFDYEDQLMTKHQYSDTPAHRAEHSKFVQAIADFKQKFDAGTATVSIEILNFLRDWLTGHIMKTDRKLGQALCKLGAR